MRSIAPLLLVACLGACSLGQFSQAIDGGLHDFQQAEASDILALSLLNSPAAPLPDGGAGPSVAVLSAFFGSRAVGDTSSAPAGLPGATVTATDSANDTAVCADLGGGSYLATSADGGLRYDPGATYTFTVALDGGSYVATGAAPTPEQVPAFQISLADGGSGGSFFTTVSVGQPYSLERAAPAAGATLEVAFVTVNALTAGSPRATPTYTNVPQTPLALLDLVVNDAPYRVQAILIPGTAFQAAGDYLVTLTAVKKGSPQGTNLFLGSAILIGTGSAGLLHAQ